MSAVGRWVRVGQVAGGWAFGRRPLRSALAALALLLLLGGLGFYGSAAYAWRQARVDYAARRYDEAAGRLAFCRRVWPRDPALLLLSAQASRQARDYVAAEDFLNRYIGTNPESRGDAQIEFLLIRLLTGDDEAAEPLFALVDQGHPASAAILEAASLSYMRRLRYLPANASLSRWAELCPDSATPYEWRGWVYERTSSPALALKDYERALELDPGLLLVRLRLVELLLEEKKIPEVTPHLEILGRQAPDRVEVQARLGMLRFLEGKSAEARGLLEDAEPRLARGDAAPLVTLARLDVQEGKGADAERRLRKVIAIDPTESDARFVLVTALRLQGKEAEAVAAEREQALIRQRNERVNLLLRDRADKGDATADELFEIGTLFLEMQMDARALYWFDKALGRDPTYQRVHRALADYYDRKGDAPQAAAHRRMLR
jgi:tetratricopeptide (TPR) repeat protein